MPRKKPASKDAYSQAVRLGGMPLKHALAYAHQTGCSLRLAVEAILIRDQSLDQVIIQPPVQLDQAKAVRRAPGWLPPHKRKAVK